MVNTVKTGNKDRGRGGKQRTSRKCNSRPYLSIVTTSQRIHGLGHDSKLGPFCRNKLFMKKLVYTRCVTFQGYDSRTSRVLSVLLSATGTARSTKPPLPCPTIFQSKGSKLVSPLTLKLFPPPNSPRQEFDTGYLEPPGTLEKSLGTPGGKGLMY